MKYQNVIENVVDTSDPKAYAEATIDTVVNSMKNQIAYNPARSPSPIGDNSFTNLQADQSSPSPGRSPRGILC